MKVILMRHGEASQASRDELRPLSVNGESEVKATAEELSLLDFKIDEIIHSPLVRAKQTAKIVSKKIGFTDQMLVSNFLLPCSDIGFWSQELGRKDANILIVGHLPYMGILAGFLTNGPMVGFNTADALILERQNGIFSIIRGIST